MLEIENNWKFANVDLIQSPSPVEGSSLVSTACKIMMLPVYLQT